MAEEGGCKERHTVRFSWTSGRTASAYCLRPSFSLLEAIQLLEESLRTLCKHSGVKEYLEETKTAEDRIVYTKAARHSRA